MSKVTAVQLKEWKEKHGGFYELPVEDKVCYLRIPTMLDFRIGFDALSEEGEVAFAEAMSRPLPCDTATDREFGLTTITTGMPIRSSPVTLAILVMPKSLISGVSRSNVWAGVTVRCVPAK